MSRKALELTGVGFTRRGADILSGIDLEVTEGQCCAIMGPNGSGKSTLLAVISGYLWATEGQVKVFGREFGKVNLHEIRRYIGLIETSRGPSFPEYLNVRQAVATGLSGLLIPPADEDASERGQQRVTREMKHMGIAEKATASFAELSTGEKMKALLARAMVSSPRMLVLDEPAAGLDMRARAEIVGLLDALRQRKKRPTIILVSHHLDELPRLVDKVVLMKSGMIVVQGRPEKTITSRWLSEVFDCEVHVRRDKGRYVAVVR